MARAALIIALPGFAAACGPAVTVVDASPAAAEGILDRLAEDTTFALAVPHHRVVRSAAEGVFLDSPGVAPTPIATGTLRTAAVAPDGALLVATDDDLARVDAFVARASLADALPLPIDALATDGDALWLGVSADEGGGAWLWRGGEVAQVDVPGAAVSAPLAARGGQAWLATADGLVGVEEDGAAWRVLTSLGAGRPTALALDADGVLFAAIEGELWTFDGAWQRATLPEPVTGVTADPAWPGAWATTATQAIRAPSPDPSGWRAYALEGAASFASADQAGRLVVGVDGGLWRLSEALGGVLYGLADGATLHAAVDLLALPTRPEGVVTLTASVDGAPVDVDAATWTLRLDPSDWPAGDHTLTARAAWSDGAEADLTPLRWTVPVPDVVTWDAQIDPLRRERCALCHDGDTSTLLDTREAWVTHIDAILSETSTGRMPLGGDALDALELATLRAWKDGGFP
jgi:hypothetical protein